MAGAGREDQQGHAFLSYVREDAATVDRLQQILEASGVPVWRDTSNLWPGEDWKLKIKQAIAEGSFAFIACFSPTSAAKERSYQREELLLAVEQMRLRSPDRSWLIPVRLGDCNIPEYDLGAGRTLRNLQRVDLFGDAWDVGVVRLTQAVHRIVDEARDVTASVTGADVVPILKQVKAILREPSRQIELEDLVLGLACEARAKLLYTVQFPIESSHLADKIEGIRYLATQCMKYWESVQPLCEALTAGCTWGTADQENIWSRAVEGIANTAPAQLSGQSVLLDLRRFPTLPVLYSGGVSAVYRNNYGALRALTIDAQTRTAYGEKVPLIGAAHLSAPFAHNEITSQVLVRHVESGSVDDDMIQGLIDQRVGRRYTPVADLLFSLLRDLLRPLIVDDEDYQRAFVRLETLLDLIAIDAQLQAEPGVYIPGPSFGSYTWRYRHGPPAEQILQVEYEKSGANWAPLAAGLFGSSGPRVEAAFDRYLSQAKEIRQRRW